MNETLIDINEEERPAFLKVIIFLTQVLFIAIVIGIAALYVYSCIQYPFLLIAIPFIILSPLASAGGGSDTGGYE